MLLAGAAVVRSAVVAAYADRAPQSAARLWPGHPSVVRSLAMGEVGEAAGSGREPSAETRARLARLAALDPLSPEPLLVDSAIAQRNRDFARAERLLVDARARDPRSSATRFLLADLYFRTGRIVPGLAEMSVLGRIVPGAMEQVAPALAAFASNAGAAPHLRRILLVYPELEPSLLARLAADPRNAGLILAIARPRAADQPADPWEKALLDSLVAKGDYARARDIWARRSGVSADRNSLFNPDFANAAAPPPFNWALASGATGVVEPANGGLRVVYYGRDTVVLASQLLLLEPGRYRLAMAVSGQAGNPRSVAWSLTCLPGDNVVLALPLKAGTLAADISVPAGCRAQRLELKGTATEFPQTADVRIDRISLDRIGG